MLSLWSHRAYFFTPHVWQHLEKLLRPTRPEGVTIDFLSGEEASAEIIVSFLRLAAGGTAFGVLCGLIGARVLEELRALLFNIAASDAQRQPVNFERK